MQHNFMKNDQVIFVQAVERHDPPELPDSLPIIPPETVGMIVEAAEESVVVRFPHPRTPSRDALLRLYVRSDLVPHCPITAIARVSSVPYQRRLPRTIAIFSGDPDDIFHLSPEERAAVEKVLQ